MPAMATPTKQALQGDRWGYDTRHHTGVSIRTTFRGGQSYEGAATIPSRHQRNSTPGISAAGGGKSPEGRGMGIGSIGGGK